MVFLIASRFRYVRILIEVGKVMDVIFCLAIICYLVNINFKRSRFSDHVYCTENGLVGAQYAWAKIQFTLLEIHLFFLL